LEIFVVNPRARTRIESNPECLRLNPDKKKLVYVSSFIKRKNQISGIKAISRYAKESKNNVQLVLVGSSGNMLNILLHAAKRHRNAYFNLIAYRGLSECCLTAIYQSSAAALYLSLAEGFGMPVQDAILERLPVIASNVPAIAERNLQNEVLLVNPIDVREIQSAVRDVAEGYFLPTFNVEMKSDLDWPALNDF
jgi:glycosyltransferase involved in cell wall biosynthesis